MKIENKLTLRHLKINKRRSIITVCGIIVSVAMITGVFVSFSSFFKYVAEITKYTEGTGIVTVYDVTPDQVESLKKNDAVSRVGLAAKSNSFRIKNGATERSCVGDMYAGDTVNLEQMITGGMEGDLPKTDTEILVERSFIEKNSLDWKIGDTVVIEAVDMTDENKVTVLGEQSYKITGILDKNIPTSFYYIVRNIGENDADYLNAVFELKKISFNSTKTISEILQSIGVPETLDRCSISRDILIGGGDFTASDTVMSFLPFIAILVGIIFTASVTLIYNAFAMSLSERTRYLGMLASVGATKKQKRRSVYFEGFLLGIIGIPLGIGFGILGIYVTLKLIGHKITETGMVMGVTNITFNTSVSLWAIAAIVIVSALTIFVSSILPAKKASKVTPIDAIRQTGSVKLKARRLRSSKPVRLVFGYEGELANKNLKRNGAKGRVITASIALSVVVFLTVNYFCAGIMDEANNQNYNYQVLVQTMKKDSYQGLVKDIKELSSSDSCLGCSPSYSKYDDLEGLRESMPDIADKSLLSAQSKNYYDGEINFSVLYIDDDSFSAFCEENGIDAGTCFGADACVVLNRSDTVSGKDVFSTGIIGRHISSGEKTLEIKALAQNDKNSIILPAALTRGVNFIAPMSTYVGSDPQNFYACVYVVTDHHAEVKQSIEDLMITGRYDDGTMVTDVAENAQSIISIVFVAKVFIYGFLILITLITIANIMNTISTGMDLRSKEFAMIKSVGTTPKGIRKMIMLESLFYGVKALVFALPISVLTTYAMYKAVTGGYVAFFIDWKLYGAAILAVFVIVGVSMLMGASKLKRMTIIDALKEDVC